MGFTCYIKSVKIKKNFTCEYMKENSSLSLKVKTLMNVTWKSVFL